MSYTVNFAPEAQEQLVALEEYIAHASGSPETASSYVDSVVAYCEGLDIFPERGMKRDDIWPNLSLVGFRRRTTVAFTVDAGIVTILGVFHGGQDVGAGFYNEIKATSERRYRVVCRLQDEALLVLLVHVGHRSEVCQ